MIIGTVDVKATISEYITSTTTLIARAITTANGIRSAFTTNFDYYCIIITLIIAVNIVYIEEVYSKKGILSDSVLCLPPRA